jgi:hypothetical protein
MFGGKILLLVGAMLILFGGFPNAPWMALFGSGANTKWISVDPIMAKVSGSLFILSYFSGGGTLLIIGVSLAFIAMAIGMLRGVMR